MAKDPAVLWYFNDWHGGTCTLSRHLKGCYMDLLFAQFNNGHLSLDEIKTVLGSDFGPVWSTLQKKFVQDDKGLYYNERLLFEKEKRKNFSSKQRDRVNNRYKSGNPSGSTYIENVNEIVNRNTEGGTGETEIVLPYHSEEFKTSLQDWIDYKRENGFRYKPKGMKACLKGIYKISKGIESKAIEAIEHAMSNGWKGIYEVKEKKSHGHTGNEVISQPKEYGSLND